MTLGASGAPSVSDPVLVQAGSGSYTLTARAAATVLGGAGSLDVTLTEAGASVVGGRRRTRVRDEIGGNTITGGAGAFGVTVPAGNDTIATGASGRNAVTLGSGENRVIARGVATISGGDGSADVTLTAPGSRVFGGGGALLVGDQGGGNTISGGAGAFAVTTASGGDVIVTGTSHTNGVFSAAATTP